MVSLQLARKRMEAPTGNLAETLAAAAEVYGRQVIGGRFLPLPEDYLGPADPREHWMHRLGVYDWILQTLHPFSFGEARSVAKTSESTKLPPLPWFKAPLWLEILKATVQVWSTSGLITHRKMQRLMGSTFACKDAFPWMKFLEEKGKIRRFSWLCHSHLLSQARGMPNACLQIHGKNGGATWGIWSSSTARDPLPLWQWIPGSIFLFQIFVKTVSGKSMLLWISAEDTGESLKTLIVQKGGFSPDSFYLMHEGKVVNEEDKLRSHQIYRNSTIHMVYRLRGGSNGNRGAVGSSSYRDAARPKGPSASATPPPSQPRPYIVEKSEDTPSLEIKNTEVRKLFRSFQNYALICRFNGYWPRSYDLHKWIHSNWTTNCEVLLCSKGFFVVQFDLKEDYQKTIEQGPWFWGRAGLFLTPWFPEFDANTMVVTKMPIWVRLPNLPIPFWHDPVLEDIGNLLGKFIKNDTAQQDQGLYTYARICVEIDLSKGLPDRIQLKYEKYKWIQVLDYENTAFRCRYCHQTGHLQDSCPNAKRFPKKKKGMNTKGKTWQAEYDPSSDGDSDIEENEPEDPQKDESNEENQRKAESEEAQQTDPKSASNDPHTGNMQIMTTSLSGSKRTHESENSESDKEKPSGQPPVDSKELVVADPQEGGWTKVKSKKKEKKGKLEDYFSLDGN